MAIYNSTLLCPQCSILMSSNCEYLFECPQCAIKMLKISKDDHLDFENLMETISKDTGIVSQKEELVEPDSLCKLNTEYSHQTALFCWCSNNVHVHPELKWYHSITNEEKTGSVVVATKAKAAGRKAGVSDTFLPVRRGSCSGLYIELKRPELKPKTAKGKGGLSTEQIEFGNFVLAQGFGFIVCYGWEEARDIVLQYLNLDVYKVDNG